MVTIKDPSLVGKKVDCPKCKFRFVIESPAEAPASDVSAGSTKKAAAGTTTKESKAKQTGDAESKPAKPKPLPKKTETEDEDEADTAEEEVEYDSIHWRRHRRARHCRAHRLLCLLW